MSKRIAAQKNGRKNDCAGIIIEQYKCFIHTLKHEHGIEKEFDQQPNLW